MKVRKQDFPPLIISCAITGGVHGKEVNPNLPELPEEQAEQTYEAYRAGASIVHIHARDPKNYARTSENSEDYRKINKLVRERCPDIVINNTTGVGFKPGTTDFYPLESRIKTLDANPEIASLNMGPIVFRAVLKKRLPPLTGRPDDVFLDALFPATYGETETLAKAMLKKGIKPEMEIYHPGQFWLVNNLIDKGLVKKPYFAQFVMGMSSGIFPTPRNVLALLNNAPPNSVINVAGLGPFQLPMTAMAVTLGLHARVGMEDNVYYKKGVLCESNAQLVSRLVRIAKEMNREIATPKQARQMLGLTETPTQYDD